jgi:hypothetical protein
MDSGGQGGTPPPAPAGDAPAKPEAPKKEEVDFGARFAALTRKERELLRKEQSLKESAARAEAYERERGEVRKDPAKALTFLKDHLGLTYQELTDLVLNDGKPSLDQQVRLLQQQLEADKAEREKAQKEGAEAAAKAAIDSHKDAIRRHVDTAGDTYELIRENEAFDDVFDTIEAYWHEHQTILPIDQACAAVEKWLEERARKLLGLKRFAAPPSAPPPSQDKPTPADAKTPPASPSSTTTTLTNGAAASAPPVESGHWLDDDESKRRAAALIRWK